MLLDVASGETALRACRTCSPLVRLRGRWVMVPLGAMGGVGRGLHFLLRRRAGAEIGE